jgi:peptidoglycan hydrolase-like protein with peptidoglycan-binding domain
LKPDEVAFLGRAGIRQVVAITVLGLLAAISAGAATHPTKKSSHKTSVHSTKAKSKKSSKKTSRQAWRRRQQEVDPARASEIQAALIRAHYLNGERSGKWDAATKSAMMRYQEDNGWQTKKVPDSRALIKLGLGPDRNQLINPDTAFIAMPEPANKGGGQQQ